MNLQAVSQPSAGSAPLAAVATSLREFLAFKLGAEEYGIDILRVQEIRSDDQRMLILVDIEKLMTSSEMGLVEQTLQ